MITLKDHVFIVAKLVRDIVEDKIDQEKIEYRKKAALKNFKHALNACRGIFERNKPFYPFDIYMAVANRIILNGNLTNEINIEKTADPVLYNLRNRKDYNNKVSSQHQAAVMVSGSRYEALAFLDIPTLIIHGTSDPLIPI